MFVGVGIVPAPLAGGPARHGPCTQTVTRLLDTLDPLIPGNILVMAEPCDHYDTERGKLDCERAAFQRLAKRLKAAFPNQPMHSPGATKGQPKRCLKLRGCQ